MSIINYQVLGIMSGTSLDGVDLALCEFTHQQKSSRSSTQRHSERSEESLTSWHFKILHAQTIPYPKKWKTTLSTLHLQSAETLARTHTQYGHYLGTLAKKFLTHHSSLITHHSVFISSHGHTIFHQPKNKFTFQLGEGAALAAAAGLPVVCDFRTTDVAFGGQGAPLVPIGDKLLFPQYDYCLNLGGIANISFDDKQGRRIAFDVCPCNLLLNHLAQQAGHPYDSFGKIASSGKLDPKLFNKLNRLAYYRKKYPKTLGREDVEKYFLPIFNSSDASIPDKLHTASRHIAYQISSVIGITGKTKAGKILITGGGTFNPIIPFQIANLTRCNIAPPDLDLIQYKEALIFAFLGLLRWTNQINTLRSVTGASRDSVSGAIYL